MRVFPKVFCRWLFLIPALLSCKPDYQESQIAKDQSLFFQDFAPTTISQITITSPYQTLNFHRQPDQSWTIAERDHYPADNLAIADLLSTFSTVKVLDQTEVAAKNLPRLGLAPPNPPTDDLATVQGTHVAFKSDTTSHSALIGHLKTSNSEASTMFGAHYDGQRLALLPSNPNRALSINHALKELTTNVAYWIDSRFFAASPVRTISLIENDTCNWTLTRTEPNATFRTKEENEPLPQLTEFVDYLFSTFRVHDVLPKDRSFEGTTKQHYNIETFSGLSYKILIGNLTPVSAEEKAYRQSVTGFLRPANITSLRKIQIRSHNATNYQSSKQLPLLDTSYLVQLPQLNQLLLTKRELLLYETRL